MHMITILLCTPQSIERFIEDPAFLRSYDSAPRSSPSPPLQVASLSPSSCVSPAERKGRRGEEGVGEEPNPPIVSKPGHLYIIQYSLAYSQ